LGAFVTIGCRGWKREKNGWLDGCISFFRGEMGEKKKKNVWFLQTMYRGGSGWGTKYKEIFLKKTKIILGGQFYNFKYFKLNIKNFGGTTHQLGLPLLI